MKYKPLEIVVLDKRIPDRGLRRGDLVTDLPAVRSFRRTA